MPECVLATVRSGVPAATTVVGSEAELFAVFVSPPPLTATLLVTVDGALAATETVKVTVG